MILDGGIFVADLFHPVGAFPLSAHDLLIETRNPGGEVNCCIRIVLPDHTLFVVDLHILLGIQQVRHLGHILYPIVTVVGYLDTSLATGFGGDQDHTIGGAGSVDGSGGSIFQHVDRFNVGGVQCVDVPAGHTVDHIQRSGVANGTQPTDVHLKPLSRHTGSLGDVHTGCIGLHCLKGID